jgi:hypothetical protein
MMVAGGIGATPLIAVMRDVLHKMRALRQCFGSSSNFSQSLDTIADIFGVKVRYPRQVRLIWVTREQVSLEWFRKEMDMLHAILSSEDGDNGADHHGGHDSLQIDIFLTGMRKDHTLLDAAGAIFLERTGRMFELSALELSDRIVQAKTRLHTDIISEFISTGHQHTCVVYLILNNVLASVHRTSTHESRF